MRAVGHVCRTNQASNTAFRGFGGPQVTQMQQSMPVLLTVSLSKHIFLCMSLVLPCACFCSTALCEGTIRTFAASSEGASHCVALQAASCGVGLQAMIVAEMWVDHMARTLGQPPEAVRARNFYREGDTTHFGQVLEGCQVGAASLPATSAARYSVFCSLLGSCCSGVLVIHL